MRCAVMGQRKPAMTLTVVVFVMHSAYQGDFIVGEVDIQLRERERGDGRADEGLIFRDESPEQSTENCHSVVPSLLH